MALVLKAQIDPSINDADPDSEGAEVRDIPFFRPSFRPSRSPALRETSSPKSGRSSSQPNLTSVPIPRRTSSTKHQETRRASVDAASAMDSITISPPTTYTSPTESRSTSVAASYQTNATSVASLHPLQQHQIDEQLRPLNEEDVDPESFNLVGPHPTKSKQYSLETRADQLFSTTHLKYIFDDPSLLLKFTAFLSSARPTSIPILIYYLDAIKALKAVGYSNAIAEALEPIPGYEFTTAPTDRTVNAVLEEKAAKAFEVLTQEDLPAYITYTYIQTVTISIQKRITGTLPVHLREASEGLAEVFCLTDPSRPDNPIVFASEEFHCTTQYGMGYVINKNCRFLQGPKTNPNSIRRLKEKITSGQEHCEVFLNYRRDGSPFMNLLMVAPLRDSRGTIRYFIGAQVDVSGLVQDCSELEGFQRLVNKYEEEAEAKEDADEVDKENEFPEKDEFQQLSEMLNLQELETVNRWGGRMHKEAKKASEDANSISNGLARRESEGGYKPRLVISEVSPDGTKDFFPSLSKSGTLSGIYENYLLVRPYPSLRILFSSPSLRVPGLLQSPLLSKIGGSARVRDELTHALAEGYGVTAKVRWVTKGDPEGRPRWIHCTPLLGYSGAVGVWMVVIVDEENSGPTKSKKLRQPPPVDAWPGRVPSPILTSRFANVRPQTSGLISPGIPTGKSTHFVMTSQSTASLAASDTQSTTGTVMLE